MFELTVEFLNYQEVMAKILKLPDLLKDARRSGLSSLGFYIMQEIRSFIESNGNGSWPKLHPLSQLLQYGYGRWQLRDFPKPTAYFLLGGFARYRINADASELETGFGKFNFKDVKRGKALQFDNTLMRYAENMGQSRSVSVTSKMRSLLGATRGAVPQRYFPLRKTTTTISIPARRLRPAIDKAIAQISGRLEKQLEGAIKRRLERT